MRDKDIFVCALIIRRSQKQQLHTNIFFRSKHLLIQIPILYTNIKYEVINYFSLSTPWNYEKYKVCFPDVKYDNALFY